MMYSIKDKININQSKLEITHLSKELKTNSFTQNNTKIYKSNPQLIQAHNKKSPSNKKYQSVVVALITP